MRFRIALISTVLFCSHVAFAGTSNPVTGSGGGITGAGTLYTTYDGNGQYTITGITGDGVTGLITPGGYDHNDNLLFPEATTSLDGQGFAFTDVMGDTGYTVDLFATGSNYEAMFLDSDGFQPTNPIDINFDLGPTQTSNSSLALLRATALSPEETQSFGFSFAQTAAQTPEPASFALLGTGFLGVAGILRRRRR